MTVRDSVPPAPTSQRAAAQLQAARPLTAALFRDSGPYVHWVVWTHLAGAAPVALGALSGILWLVRSAARSHQRGWAFAARASGALALLSVAISFWLVSTPPPLRVARRVLTQAVRTSLAQRAGVAPSAVSSPPWAARASRTLLTHYAAYLRGRFSPKLPPSYRLVLVTATGENALSSILSHNTAPLPVVVQEVVGAVLSRVPVSATAAVAAAGRVAVGLSQGTAVTAYRRTPVLLMAVFVASRAPTSAGRQTR